MAQSDNLEDLLKAVDEYKAEKAKNAPAGAKNAAKEIPVGEPEVLIHEDLCDDPGCVFCRLTEYEEILTAYLDMVSSNPEDIKIPPEFIEGFLSKDNLTITLLHLMIRLDLVEAQSSFLLGNTESLLERIHTNPLYTLIKSAMAEKKA